MNLFLTPSTQHLTLGIDGARGKYISKTFSDGEKYVRVEEEIKGKVWVIANTNPPADNLLELFFLLDALQRLSNDIHLLIPYFAYARQDKITQRGEPLSAKVICDFLRHFPLKKIIVVHIHSKRIKEYLVYENLLPLHLVSSIVGQMDIVAAPDKGGIPFATMVGREHGLPVVYVEKRRLTDKKVEVTSLSGEVRGKRVMIVDDMITTGSTITKATEKLMDEGAEEVHVYATHGIFSEDAREKLEKSPVKHIYVTNSLPQKADGKIKVIDISNSLQEVINRE
ncbi:MAG TPA: ribose-phosphate diphosphokinase [Thermodesulfobacteriota bacterium]|nr:ribose-phosphate diphosphokinase [Thermodesulfobacteriota bacterium]